MTVGTMPYNTRRKSLSLSELGIIVPKRSRTASHPSPPSTIVEGEEPPVKKSKRSHGSPSPPPMSPPRPTTTTAIRIKEERPHKRSLALSPPPSPKAEGGNKVDVEGINDDIVVATIRQLEKTGNRPHLVKELALVLASGLHNVEKSANPCALISSRLTAYLNRSWPAISPCPLAKDLSAVHPRRLYFFLTTTPHQPIPEVPPPLPELKRNISPPQSSASIADEEDERDIRRRTALSPSPEVDLSSPELDDDHADRSPAPGAPFSGRDAGPRDSRRSSSLSHHKRAASPQLEREERDFKQTASHLFEQAQLRRTSHPTETPMEACDAAVAGAAHELEHGISMSIEESEEVVARKHHDDAAALFGQADHLKLPATHGPLMSFSSPVIQPQREPVLHPSLPPPQHFDQPDEAMEGVMLHLDPATDPDLSLSDAAFAWDALQCPESVELAELDDMFDAY